MDGKRIKKRNDRVKLLLGKKEGERKVGRRETGEEYVDYSFLTTVSLLHLSLTSLSLCSSLSVSLSFIHSPITLSLFLPSFYFLLILPLSTLSLPDEVCYRVWRSFLLLNQEMKRLFWLHSPPAPEVLAPVSCTPISYSETYRSWRTSLQFFFISWRGQKLCSPMKTYYYLFHFTH